MYCLARSDGDLARLGVEPLEQVRRVVPRVALDLLEQQLLGLLGGQARDPLELVLLADDQPLVLFDGGCRRPLPLADRFLPPRQIALGAVDGRLAFGETRLAAHQRLLERLRLLALVTGLLLGLGQQLVGFFLGFEEGFLLAGLGVALGVLDDAQRLFFGASNGLGGDALAVGHPHREHGGGRHHGDQDVDHIPEIWQHA